MTVAMTNNGRLPRKTLATQLDRLDVILDGLADALNGSVETAVRDVVGQAVREAVTQTLDEVLGHPAIQKVLLASQEPPRRGSWTSSIVPLALKLIHQLGKATQAASTRVRNLVQTTTMVLSQQANQFQAWLGVQAASILQTMILACWWCKRTIEILWQRRQVMALVTTLGILVAALSYALGPMMASLLSGTSTATMVLLTMVAFPRTRTHR